jgi:RIO kinase 1
LGKNKDNEQMEALQAFIDDGTLEDVLGTVKSGKEATVYACRASDRGGGGLVAAKVYRSRDVRRFGDDSMYTEGRLRQRQRRETRAIESKSRAGVRMAFGKWVADEYETLRVLHRAGADVPRPLAQSDSVILMEYLGEEDDPAPTLSSVRLEPDEARRVFGVVLRNIELALSCDRVHGDLSAYNILYDSGAVRLIDFPQAVDARFSAHALTLLERDIVNVLGYFGRFGVQADGWRLARDLWGRFLRSEL